MLNLKLTVTPRMFRTVFAIVCDVFLFESVSVIFGARFADQCDRLLGHARSFPAQVSSHSAPPPATVQRWCTFVRLLLTCLLVIVPVQACASRSSQFFV
jgi:hypothetical protein